MFGTLQAGSLSDANTVSSILVAISITVHILLNTVIVRLKRDGTRTETRFRLSPKRTNPFKSVGASVQSTAGSRDVRMSISNAGYTRSEVV